MDVLPLSTCAEPGTPHELKVRDASSAAVASRQWYKTASKICDATTTEAMAIRSLPGHFSTRGDWFLAVAEGSRSSVLADRALDLLSSMRANFARLRLGLGLPTRHITSRQNMRAMRTALTTLDAIGHRRGVSYKELLDLCPGCRADAWWLWRSSLKSYDHHARLWERSVGRVLVMWNEVRRTELTTWVDCFQIYDSLVWLRAGRTPSLDFNRIKQFESFKQWQQYTSTNRPAGRYR